MVTSSQTYKVYPLVETQHVSKKLPEKKLDDTFLTKGDTYVVLNTQDTSLNRCSITNLVDKSLNTDPKIPQDATRKLRIVLFWDSLLL